jgi:alkylglycerol monooxygenase
MIGTERIHQFGVTILVMMLLVALEYVISLRSKKRPFRFNESFTNVACGIIERVAFLLFALLYYQMFTFLYEHYRLFTIPVHGLSLLILFLLVDLLWYIYHRSGHRINILWAAHITHHQSKDFNLTVSFRVSSLQLLIRMFFWALLPLMGFDPTATIMMIGINAGYQFFIHTHIINKLGFFEKIWVTPSHHRVHHGKNDKYIDKNYGGILIIWDKLFGTFEEENEEVIFGITDDIQSHSPIAAYFHFFKTLIHTSHKKKGVREKIMVWFAPPESLSDEYKKRKTQSYYHSFTPYAVHHSPTLKAHILIQIGWLILGLYAMYTYFNITIHFIQIIWYLCYYVMALLSLHSLLKHEKHVGIEVIRLAITLPTMWNLLGSSINPWGIAMITVGFVCSNIPLVYIFSLGNSRLYMKRK